MDDDFSVEDDLGQQTAAMARQMLQMAQLVQQKARDRDHARSKADQNYRDRNREVLLSKDPQRSQKRATAARARANAREGRVSLYKSRDRSGERSDARANRQVARERNTARELGTRVHAQQTRMLHDLARDVHERSARDPGLVAYFIPGNERMLPFTAELKRNPGQEITVKRFPRMAEHLQWRAVAAVRDDAHQRSQGKGGVSLQRGNTPERNTQLNARIAQEADRQLEEVRARQRAEEEERLKRARVPGSAMERGRTRGGPDRSDSLGRGPER